MSFPLPTTLSGFLVLLGLFVLLIGGEFIKIKGVTASEIKWKRCVSSILGGGLIFLGLYISSYVWQFNADNPQRTHMYEPKAEYPNGSLPEKH